MKKSKLLLPLVALTSLTVGTSPIVILTSCGGENKQEIMINFETNDWATIIGTKQILVEQGKKWGEIQDKLSKLVIQPVKDCTLEGWYCNGDLMKPEDLLTDNMTIIAKYITPYDNTSKLYGFVNGDWREYENICEIYDPIKWVSQSGQSGTIERNKFNERVYIGRKITTRLDGGFLEFCTSFNQPVIIPEGVEIIGGTFLGSCKSFNQPIVLPSSLTYIEAEFLDGCYAFNQPIVLPSNLTEIGPNFLQNCTSFCQPLILPDSLEEVDPYFMTGCDSFNVSINIQNLQASIFSDSDDQSTLATKHADAPMFVDGINIIGTNKSDFISRFPYRDDGVYRNLK